MKPTSSCTSTTGVDTRVVELLNAILEEARATRELLAAQVESLRTGSNGRGAASKKTASTEVLLTAKQLAAVLGVNLRTLREMRHAGKAPRGFRLGRSLRWRQCDVDAWIAKEAQG